MAFGLSADPTRTLMLGADATVAWIDRTGTANAQDYHLSSYIQVMSFVTDLSESIIDD